MTALDVLMMSVEMDPNSGCWLWSRGTAGRGYGIVTVDGERRKAHRLSWELHRGEIGDKYVCHKCDTPQCINPDHLFLGTHSDNVRDMCSKGRMWRQNTPRNGEDGTNVKLTESQVVDIRKLRADGLSWGKLGSLFPHVTISCLRRVVERASWAHIQ